VAVDWKKNITEETVCQVGYLPESVNQITMPHTSSHLFNITVPWYQFLENKWHHTGHIAIILCYSTTVVSSEVNTHSDPSVRHSFNDNMLTNRTWVHFPGATSRKLNVVNIKVEHMLKKNGLKHVIAWCWCRILVA